MSLAIMIAQFFLILGLLFGLWRVIIGPHTLNRLLALEYICACIIALITVYSIEKGTTEYLEIILIFSLLGFATIISFMEVHFSIAKETKGDNT